MGKRYMISRGLFQPQLSCNSVIFKLGVVQLSSSTANINLWVTADLVVLLYKCEILRVYLFFPA